MFSPKGIRILAFKFVNFFTISALFLVMQVREKKFVNFGRFTFSQLLSISDISVT